MVRLLPIVILVTLLGCRDNVVHVEHIKPPEYPLRARFENAQGTVTVRIGIAADGTVIFATGSGAPDVLVQAAEENVKQWTFGPFPRVAVFPVEHTIEYVYKLEGKPQIAGYEPTVRTFLPDKIEISATPLVSDYPPIIQNGPAHKR